jgi:hypothetical protein
MDQSILPIFLAVVGLVGTLSGVWLGNRLTRGNEERKWRRDQCLEAYTDVLHTCTIVQYESTAAYVSECGTSDHLRQASIVLEKVAEMYRAADRAILLGPQEVHKSVSELTVFCGKEVGGKSTKTAAANLDSAKHFEASSTSVMESGNLAITSSQPVCGFV